MSAAVIAKLKARQAFRSADDFLGYLTNSNEKKFIRLFEDGLRRGVLDVQYYLTLWCAIKQLPKKHRIAMQRVIGAEIDMQNIIWLYRLKRFYQIFGDASYGYLVPIRHRLTKDEFIRLVQSDTTGFMKELSQMPYANVFNDFRMAQRRLRDALCKRYKAEKGSYIAQLSEAVYEMYRN